MLSRVKSYGLMGLDGFAVDVDVDVSNGLPAYDTVGLPDAAVRESRERVRAAIRNSGFMFPTARITVNLAPADLRKEGSVYDLPIAIGILTATGQLDAQTVSKYMFLGELALDGSIREVAGVLPMIIGAYKEGMTSVILPSGNANEASFVDGASITAVESLSQAVDHIRGKNVIPIHEKAVFNGSHAEYATDFSDIKGQHGAKRAAEIAVAGGHNILLIGTPGSGKTMLAKAIPSILPELSFEEALEITKIHSVTGAMKGSAGLVSERPFRSPHHTASGVSLVGGGSKALPGEISLAHYGVLFLDELPEFKKEVLEALRQPMEDGCVTITRANARSTYPADFMLVAAMNPCPCGNFGSRINTCRCSKQQVLRYRNKISGPMLDRVDLHIEMTEVGYSEITARSGGETSESIRKRVNAARKLQLKRYENEGILFNAQLTSRLTAKYCILDDEAEEMLKQAFNMLKLSARAYTRILKVSRTIADIEGAERIGAAHIAEAIQYRCIDNKYWEGAQ